MAKDVNLSAQPAGRRDQSSQRAGGGPAGPTTTTNGNPASLLQQLQRTVGNRVVTRLLRGDSPANHQPQAPATATPQLQRFEARVHESAEMVGLTGTGGLSPEEANAVYFGNWMRDMNQVFVPFVEELGLTPEVTFAALSYLGAKKFGRAMTPEQFGYYIPSEHIDNPAGLVPAQQAPDDLYPTQPDVPHAAQVPGAQARPPEAVTPQEDVDPRSSQVGGLGIFQVDQAGVIGFIRRTNEHVERRLRLAVSRGRNPDGMMHLGAALHAVEDLFAHSNWVEIAVQKLLREEMASLQAAVASGGAPLAGGDWFTQQERLHTVQEVAGTDRPENVNVFNYAPERQVASGENRPVLTTGSFSSTDTQISLASELGTILGQPLPEPRSNAEGEAEERFVTVLLRNFEGQLAGNAALRNELSQTLIAQGVPKAAVKPLLAMPIATLYSWTRLPPFVPDAVRLPIKRTIRNALSSVVLQPLGQQLQASALDARIESSTQANVLREHQRIGAGKFSKTENEAMQVQADNGGPSVKAQQQEKQAVADRHNSVLQHTPEAIVAGPSHSQIAKDHANSPFFGLAFKLATEAVRRLRVKVMAAWAQGGAGGPFSFEQANYPAGPDKKQKAAANQIAADNQALFHETRDARLGEIAESTRHGQAILSQGGANPQPYRLAEMRARDAAELRQTAAVLSALASGPGQADRAIGQLNALLGDLLPQETEKLRQQLNAAQKEAKSAGNSAAVAEMKQCAADLTAAAARVQSAESYADRAGAQTALQAIYDRALQAAGALGRDQHASTIALSALNRHIGHLAAAYSQEQRGVLASVDPQSGQAGQHLRGYDGGQAQAEPQALPAGRYQPPANNHGSAELRALIAEARLLMNHPYESDWWGPLVREYLYAHPEQLQNDVSARNEGVPFYRGGPAEKGHGHNH